MTAKDRTILNEGFAVIDHCYSPDECDAIAVQVDEVTAAGTRCLLDRDWARDLVVSLKCRVAGTIPDIGSLVAVQCTFFNKSSAQNWFVAYHQDRSIPVASNVSAEDWSGWSEKEGTTFVHGPDELLAQMIAVRLHVDDCSEGNGPLRIIPGSHNRGTLSPQEIETIRGSRGEQNLLVSRGGVVVMRPLLLHASSKSRKPQHRRVLHFLFGPASLSNGLEWNRRI